MVAFMKKFLLILMLVCQCFFFGCTVDLPGFFVSHNLDERFRERNTFNFLTDADRAISLPAEYSFIVVSDTHIINEEAYGLEKLAGLVAADSEIKFVVVLGDITQCANEVDIIKFKDIGSSLGVPCYPVIGNHDVYFNNWKYWKKHIGSSTYRINTEAASVGKATLFMLDSANGHFGKPQLDWLETELKSAQGRVFVFSHTNLFVQDPADIQQQTDFRERARFMAILKKGRCNTMFSGHLHTRIFNKAGGVQYLAIDGYVEEQIYCYVTVKNDGLDYKFRKLK